MKRSKSGDPAHDVLGYERQQLDVIFRPETVAVVGATERPGSVGRTIMWNLVSSPFGGTVFPVNSRRPNVLGIKAYPSVSEVPARVDLAVIVAPAPAVPDIIGECVEAGVEGAIIISAGFRETGPEGVELERTGPRGGQAGQDEDHRPQLPRRHEAANGLQRHLRGRHRPSGKRGTPEPERGFAHGHPRSELHGERGVLGARQRRVHDGRGLGGPDLLPRRRSRDEEHRGLHGVRRRRPLVPLGGPRGRPDQADHSDQSRTHRGRRQGRRLPHGLPDRLRRGARRGLLAQRRAARGRDLRALRYGRGPRQAAAPERPAPDHPDQRRRPRRACHRRPDRQRRRARRDIRRDHGGPERLPPRPLEPRQPGRRARRRRSGALREDAAKPRRATPRATVCSSSSRRRT